MNVHDLPLLNAVLNGTSAVLLLIARNRIKHKAVSQHRALMLAAFTCSMLFLVSYLTYHAQVGSVHFTGQGWSRPFYFLLLGTHTLLATAVPVLATMTLVRGLRARYTKHKDIAKWTYPVWLYVSATGVLIYLMLYQFYPSAG